MIRTLKCFYWFQKLHKYMDLIGSIMIINSNFLHPTFQNSFLSSYNLSLFNFVSRDHVTLVLFNSFPKVHLNILSLHFGHIRVSKCDPFMFVSHNLIPFKFWCLKTSVFHAGEVLRIFELWNSFKSLTSWCHWDFRARSSIHLSFSSLYSLMPESWLAHHQVMATYMVRVSNLTALTYLL